MASLNSPSHSAATPQVRNVSTLSRFERNREKALELFASKGFGQVSLRELAAHLELTAGALYHHCSSKEDLLFEFIEEHYEGLLALLPRCARGGSTLEVVRNLTAALLRQYQRRPLHFQLAMSESRCLGPLHRQRIGELREQFHQRLLQHFGIGPEVDPALRQGAGQAIAHLLEQMPTWMNHSSLPETERLALLENLTLGAVSQLLSHIENRHPIQSRGFRRAAILRKPA
ncbi:TetR/AcrR family transcriptional regulator [Pseudomonas sp. GCM10022186]|uniref:TetR/AcrR family transcriptional regulator n=1 Tax=Pseudomonas sp. GCM10022186 TaxID=3252650 RepID=UPI0036223F8B